MKEKTDIAEVWTVFCMPNKGAHQQGVPISFEVQCKATCQCVCMSLDELRINSTTSYRPYTWNWINSVPGAGSMPHTALKPEAPPPFTLAPATMR